MSIASEITRINTNIANSYTAVDNKNGTLPQVQNSANLASAIDSIEVIEQATAEGESISLTNTKAMPYSDYVVEGKSEQDGEPSPSNLSEIHSVADDVNLFDISNIVPTTVMTPNSNGGFKIQKVGTARISDEYHIDIPANTNVVISRVLKQYSSNATIYCQWKATDNTTIWTPNIYADTVTTSFNKDIKGIVFYLQETASDGDYVEIEKLKIQKGTVATPYSPYNQGTVTIKQRGTTENNDYTIQTEPLRSLPNGVKDTIEADGIHRRVGRVVLDGSEDWSTTGTFTSGIYRPECSALNGIIKAPSSPNISPAILCDYYNAITNNQSYTETEGISISASGSIRIYDSNYNTDDISLYKTWLSTHNTEVLYELAEEIIEPLTQNQANTMLDIIKTGSYEGTTNIYTDEDVKPTMNVGYCKKV